jgi:polysaccharide export outer membrane protein
MKRFPSLFLLWGCLAAVGVRGAVAAPENTKPAARPAAPVTSAEPIDRNHHLGPGDTVEITVKGLEELSRTVRLFKDGTFDYPVLKSVQAAGLTIHELAAKLTEGLGKELRRPQVTVTLVDVYVPPPTPKEEVKVPKITVLGAVSKKGILDLPEPRPLRTLLAEVGPTERADLSQIRVRYPDGSARTADFSKFNATGEAKDDFLVKGGEELIVLELPPPPKPEEKKTEYVRIGGQVANPNQYELKPGMTLEDLIIAAGRLSTVADLEHVQVRRKGQGERTVDLVAQQQKGLNGKVTLQAEDEVFIPEQKDVILLVGAVPNPGQKGFRPGQTVRDFFLQGGPELTAALNPAAVNLSDVQLIRKGREPEKVDLKELLKRPNRKDNLALQSGDILFIPPKKEKKAGPLGMLGQVAGLTSLFGLF